MIALKNYSYYRHRPGAIKSTLSHIVQNVATVACQLNLLNHRSRHMLFDNKCTPHTLKCRIHAFAKPLSAYRGMESLPEVQSMVKHDPHQSFTILKISYILYYRYLKILFRICISYIRDFIVYLSFTNFKQYMQRIHRIF